MSHRGPMAYDFNQCSQNSSLMIQVGNERFFVNLEVNHICAEAMFNMKSVSPVKLLLICETFSGFWDVRTPAMFRLNSHWISIALFLFYLIVGVYSTYQNQNFFAKICTSAFLDSPLDDQRDTSHRYDIATNRCSQKFSFVATKEEADHFCGKAMPFDVVEAKTDKNSTVSCTWSPGGMCPPDYIQVYDKCYRTPVVCDASEKIASPSQEDHIRWLTRIIHLFRPNFILPLIVKMTNALRTRKVYEKKYLKDGHFFDTNGVSDLKWTMITDFYSIHQLKPGDIVQSISFRHLCEKKPISTGITAESVPSSPIYPVSEEVKGLFTGASRAQGSIQLSEGKAFITRNEYYPKLVSNGKLDNGYFHEVCESICDNCVAASGELLMEIGKTSQLPMGSYHVPMSREGTANKGSDNCIKESKVTERRKFYSMIKPGVTEYIPVDDQWLENDGIKHPTGLCSDHERVAVQFFQGNGFFGFIDAPAFARKPVICYRGVVPQKPRGAGECYKNSEILNGKCQCKKGFTDGHNTALKSIIIMKGYKEEGFICLPPPSCNKILVKRFPYKGFFFLADGSGTVESEWSKVHPFVKMFEQFIPNSVPVWLIQWSSTDRWDCKWKSRDCPGKYIAVLDAGWTKEEYYREAENVFVKWQDGATTPYHYINEIADKWIEYKRLNKLDDTDRALVIMVSDGEYQDDESFRRSAIRKFKQGNMRLVGAQEMSSRYNFDFTHYYEMMDAPNDHIRIPKTKDKLNEKLSFRIMENTCLAYQEADIDDAI